MKRTARLVRLGAGATLAALLICACASKPFELSSADRQRFGDRILRVPVAGSAAPMIFGLADCTVFKAKTEGEKIAGWDVVLRSDWGASYPKFMTSCTRQGIRYDGKYVRVFLCAQAIGAGGGCGGGGGNYRSADGQHHWEISSTGSDWKPLPR